MQAKRLIMDGTTYRIRIKYDTLVRAFELVEGVNAGEMLSGRYERDLVGTKYSYQMSVEPDPLYRADYDAFFEAISDPTAYHTITVPYGQTTLTYQAMVESGSDSWHGVIGNKNNWTGLVVNFVAISVQKEPS